MRGFQAVRQASAAITDRKNSGGDYGPKELWPGLRNNGDSVTVRFLEQGDEVHCAWMHEYKKPNQNKSEFVKCLDQNDDGTPCPGCENGVKRTFKGYINVIWRDSPQLKRDPETNRAIKDEATGQYVIEGAKDEVAVWVQGITVFEDLADKDQTYRGLSSRDFKITRRGLKLSTKYIIDPVLDENGNANSVPLTAADEELAANKPDIVESYLKPLTYDETAAILNGSEHAVTGGGVTAEDVNSSQSPFVRGEQRVNRFLDS